VIELIFVVYCPQIDREWRTGGGVLSVCCYPAILSLKLLEITSGQLAVPAC